MTCIKCKNPVYFERLCRNCLCKQVEKRIRKDLRLSKAVKKDDVLLIKDPISEYFIRKIISMPIKIVKKGRYDKEVLPFTLDDEVLEFLENFIEKKSFKENKKKIKLFRTVKDDELKAFAKVRKIKYEKKPKESEIRKIIDEMDKKYPPTKFNLLKSSEKLKAILGNVKK